MFKKILCYHSFRIGMNLCFYVPKHQMTVLKSQTPCLFQNLQDRILDVVQKNLKLSRSMIPKDENFKDLGLDSLDIVDMVIDMERSIGIDITNDEAQEIWSIETAANIFYQHLHDRVS